MLFSYILLTASMKVKCSHPRSPYPILPCFFYCIWIAWFERRRDRSLLVIFQSFFHLFHNIWEFAAQVMSFLWVSGDVVKYYIQNVSTILLKNNDRALLVNNYWMRLSRRWRIIQIEEDVSRRGRGWRPGWITSSLICIILHIVRQLLLIQNICCYLLADFFQNFGLFLGTVSGYKQTFFLQILLKKKIKSIKTEVQLFRLRIAVKAIF